MPTHQLTDATVRSAKPHAKPYKLADGGGLFLLVHPNGSRYWRLKYWTRASSERGAPRKEKLAALGVYPSVALKDARGRAEEARRLIKAGIDPVVQRRVDKAKAQQEQASTFETTARAWLASKAAEFTPAHHLDCTQRLERHVFPVLGALPLRDVDAATVATLLKGVQQAGRVHMAGRLRTMISQIFRYAIASGLVLADPARDVGAVLTPRKPVHMPALTTLAALKTLLADVEASRASAITKIGTRLLALLAVRTIELRGARWTEIDFDNALWEIPEERMKKRTAHVVPLPTQAMVLLRELHTLTGTGAYLFPGGGPRHPIMSESTINSAIKRAGYEGRHTGHGFRAAFSTIMNEEKFRPDVIEFALAHVSGDRVRSAYNRTDYLQERRELMQAWADMLSGDSPDGTGVPTP